MLDGRRPRGRATGPPELQSVSTPLVHKEWEGIDFVHPDPCRSKVKPRPLISLLETGAWLRIDL